MTDPAVLPAHIEADIAKRFTYHAPKVGQPELYEELRSAAKDLARRISGLCPESRERSLAITHLEEVVFWANASVARNP